MKMAGDIGALVVIGLLVWWLTRSKQARVAGLPTTSEISEYEKLHTYVPITAKTERLFEVYGGQ